MNVVVAELIASDLLADPHGGIALKTLHRFLAYNMEWIGQVQYLKKKFKPFQKKRQSFHTVKISLYYLLDQIRSDRYFNTNISCKIGKIL